MIEELNIGTDPYAAEWHIQMMADKGYEFLGRHFAINGFQIGRFKRTDSQEPNTEERK